MMTSPKISVVMSLYNSAKYLREAIDSILTQTFTDFEFIIIDDGSKDEGADIVRSYTDSRIRFIQQENQGLPAALNVGIQVARSELIARMDPDDICMPTRLEKQFGFMLEYSDVVALGSAAHIMDVDGGDVCILTLKCDDSNLRKCFPGSPFIHPSVMFRKKAGEKVGGYPEDMRLGGEDVVLFAKLSKLGLLSNIEDPLIYYRLVPNSLSRKPASFQTMLTKIIAMKMDNQFVSEAEFNKLRDEAIKIVKSEAMIHYHYEITKLLVWSGSGSNEVKKYFDKTLALRSFSLRGWLLYGMSFLPKKWISNVYGYVKGRKYSSISMGTKK